MHLNIYSYQNVSSSALVSPGWKAAAALVSTNFEKMKQPASIPIYRTEYKKFQRISDSAPRCRIYIQLTPSTPQVVKK